MRTQPITIALLVALLAWQRPVNGLEHYAALVSGQSNACSMPSLPDGCCQWVCQGGAAIAAWDAGQTLGQQFRAKSDAYQFDVLVWWQGETDAANGTDPYVYGQKLYDLMAYSNRPVMILEIGTVPGDTGQVTAVHQYFARTDPATAPYVAFIPTSDLEHDGYYHFTSAGYAAAVDRLVACYNAACWGTQ